MFVLEMNTTLVMNELILITGYPIQLFPYPKSYTLYHFFFLLLASSVLFKTLALSLLLSTRFAHSHSQLGPLLFYLLAADHLFA